MALDERLTAVARQLVEREGQHSADLDRARVCAQKLHERLAAALEGFHAQVMPSAPQLALTLGEPRVDEKHLHAVQFELERGRYRAIVTVKSRGEVTLVGPFRKGGVEGPCRSFPVAAEADIEVALEDFVLAFIEEAATP